MSDLDETAIAYLELAQEFIQGEIQWIDDEVVKRCSRNRNASRVLKKVRNHLEQACQELEPFKREAELDE